MCSQTIKIDQKNQNILKRNISSNLLILESNRGQILTLFGVICIDYMVTSPHKHNIFKSQAWDMIKYLIMVTFEKYNKSDQPDICAINEIK